MTSILGCSLNEKFENVSVHILVHVGTQFGMSLVSLVCCKIISNQIFKHKRTAHFKVSHTWSLLLTFISFEGMVCWVVTTWNDAVEYNYIGGPCCLHCHYILKIKAAWSSKMLVSYHFTAHCHNLQDHNVNHDYH